MKNPLTHDDTIVGQQHHTYSPYTTSFNCNDEVRIVIQSQDVYVLPSESYLYIEFKVSLLPSVTLDENVQFAMNYGAHLFSELRYELNGIEIDRCKTPGITTLMKNMCAAKLDEKNSLLLFTQKGATNVEVGSYRLILPLRYFFGFCEDYNKIILNSKHELILLRNRSDDNVFISDVRRTQLTINKIQWKMPHITLSDQAKLVMLKTLNRNDDLTLAYRSWDLYELPAVPSTTRHTWAVKTTTQLSKPRYIFVAFQTNRNYNIARDAAEFDHCNITDLKLYLNNERYPYDNLHLNFADGHYQELFYMYLNIQKSYYNGTGGCNPFDIEFDDFEDRVIFPFDCSRSDENIKHGMVDVRIELNSSSNITANTTAYCLIIHDNFVRYSPLTGIVNREI